MRKHTAVSIEAPPDYVTRLAVYAKMHNVTVGSMVRTALDEKFGDDIASFFTEGVAFTQKINADETTAKKVSQP